MVYTLGKAAKAVVAGLSAGAAALAVAAQDGVIDFSDGISIVAAVLGALGITYFVPNKA